MRIKEERLEHDSHPIFEFKLGEAQLYHDDYEKGPAYPFDWSRSGLGALHERPDNRKLTRFKEDVANWIIVACCPPIMEPETRTEDQFLDPWMRNFVGWYWRSSNENMGAVVELVVVVSHHPVTIDYMAGASGRWFFRDGDGPARLSEGPTITLADGISLSDAIARRWE